MLLFKVYILSDPNAGEDSPPLTFTTFGAAAQAAMDRGGSIETQELVIFESYEEYKKGSAEILSESEEMYMKLAADELSVDPGCAR